MFNNPLHEFEGKFYQSMEKDCTTYEGFQHSSALGAWTTAPDWDLDPDIDCGKGLHIVKGHPLLSWDFVERDHPVYAEVETDPNPPIASRVAPDKFRAEKIKKIRWIGKDDPEFSDEVLRFLVLNSESPIIQQQSLKLLGRKHKALFRFVLETSDDPEVLWVALRKFNKAEQEKTLIQVMAPKCLKDTGFAIDFLSAAKHVPEAFLRLFIGRRVDGEVMADYVVPLLAQYDNGELLIEAISSIRDYYLRAKCVCDLNSKRHERVIFELACNDKEEDIRAAAVEKLSPKKYRDDLASILVSDDSEVVRAAVAAKLNLF